MNIILSCASDKKKSRGAVIISKGGRRVVEESFSLICREGGITLKEYMFETLIKGLKLVGDYINHDDLLLIEVSNRHMVDWLNGSQEYKDYNSYLDEVYSILESLDCRYLFTVSNVKEAKKLLEVVKEEKLEGIADAFEGLL